ncbi:MAG: DUF2141 domain-containing protein [Bacteroidota bacterium]
MFYTILLNLLLLSGSASITINSAPTAPPATSTLEVKVTNVKKAKGSIMLAIYDSAENFMGPDYFRTATEVVNQTGAVVVQVPELPFGSYAITIYHDENGNNELDTNLFGIPSESYGFSNNARRTFGPPSYDEARFDFSENGQIIEVKVK